MYERISTSTNSIIDIRSDTVTQPGAGMRKAMAEAEVGDDVYGGDPTVQKLERRVADLLGKEAGLFVTSGTQSNFLALLSHCQRGHEYISGKGYHIPKYEASGSAVLGGISQNLITPDADGGLDPESVEAAIQPDDEHFAITRLICLENTHNGVVQDFAKYQQIHEIAQRNNLLTHLDGARLMNAVVASGRSAKDWAKPFNSVSLCLSKGLGAPVGSVLVGDADFISTARRYRKMVGGGLRQSGVLAACGLYALDHHVDRMADDHENAKKLGQRLNEIDGLNADISRVQTNMVWLDVDDKGQSNLADHMAERNINCPTCERGSPVRLVTHLDFSKDQIDAVVDGFASWMGQA